jgi:hypothetical protein
MTLLTDPTRVFAAVHGAEPARDRPWGSFTLWEADSVGRTL